MILVYKKLLSVLGVREKFDFEDVLLIIDEIEKQFHNIPLPENYIELSLGIIIYN